MESKRLTSRDVKKIEHKDKSDDINDNLSKDKNKNQIKYSNESRNENENENENKNEDGSDNENVIFLRVLTASLCELLTTRYGHDILDGKLL